MGYLSEFVALIERLRECAEKYKDYLANNEAATRACLVDPVLHLLGWDVSNPEQVRVEFKVEGKSADYALMRDGKPLILIEAKSLGAKIKDDFWQLAVYASRTGASVGVMTNGDDWVFLDPSDTSRPQRASLRLLSQEPRLLTIELLSQLDRADVSCGLDQARSPDLGRVLGLRQLEGDLSQLGPNIPAPKLRAVRLPSHPIPRAVHSYTGLICAVGEAYLQNIADRLPITETDASRRYIAARSPQHGTGARFLSSRKLLGAGGQEFYVNLHAKAHRLVRRTIRLLSVVGVDPDEVMVELA